MQARHLACQLYKMTGIQPLWVCQIAATKLSLSDVFGETKQCRLGGSHLSTIGRANLYGIRNSNQLRPVIYYTELHRLSFLPQGANLLNVHLTDIPDCLTNMSRESFKRYIIKKPKLSVINSTHTNRRSCCPEC